MGSAGVSLVVHIPRDRESAVGSFRTRFGTSGISAGWMITDMFGSEKAAMARYLEGLEGQSVREGDVESQTQQPLVVALRDLELWVSD